MKRTKKRLVAGFGVLVVLIIYSAAIRNQLPRISKPASLTQHNAPAHSSSGSSPPTPSIGNNTSSTYKDGTYTGSVTDAYYGNVQVAATIKNGKITNVKFLQYPNTHETSVYINQQAMPYLQQESIKSQSASVNIISGATFTSQAFQQSLASALSQAWNRPN